MVEALSAAPDALQWDYQLLHQEPANSAQGLNEDIPRSVLAMFRGVSNDDLASQGPRMWNKYMTMFDQRERFAKGENPWIPLLSDGSKSDVTLDERLLTEADAAEYTHYLTENGGFEVPGY